MPDRLTTDTNALISAMGLSVRLDGRDILNGIDLSIGEKEIVTVIGPNGAGKSTLIKTFLGLIAPTTGNVVRRAGLTIGYMPQSISLNRNMPMSVRRFVGMSVGGGKGQRQAVFEETGVAHIVDSSIHDVSGGEFQRALLARALLRDPDLLVLDEPAQAVDISGQAELYRLIEKIRDRRCCGVLMVSHDLHLVMSATDRVVCINNHLCCAGHPEAVSRDPSYVALFGDQVAATLALYHHDHDHTHTVDGHVVHHHGDEHEHHHEDYDHG
ncbi:MAG: metal ABC transporter ATP-binding protein [Rhodospirillaceae bacterium]